MPCLHGNENPASRERREDKIFHELLKLCHGLDERLSNSSAEEVELMADLVSAENNVRCFFLIYGQIQRGANAARADDTKGMKGTIIDWITPPGQSIIPPLNRKMKFDRGFHHEATGSLLCPAGVNWDNPE
jgi:hypothetical protein